MTTIVSIPDCNAIHVLGSSTVDLSTGRLTLVETSNDNVQAPTNAVPIEGIVRTPILALTIGTASFPLYETSLFGTDPEDERVYLFQPEIGPQCEQSGFVRVTLPKDVRVEGSGTRELQELFEKALVKRGLLQPTKELNTSGSVGDMASKVGAWIGITPPSTSREVQAAEPSRT